MVDRYTKTMLTIIAASLLCLVVQGAMPRAAAAGHMEGCGSDINFPCFVTNDGIAPLTVTRQ
jgi:hypothetical protein